MRARARTRRRFLATICRPLLGLLVPLVLGGTSAAAAPVRVMTVPSGAARLAKPRLAALPSGDIVLAQRDTDLLYAARTGDRWTPTRKLSRLVNPYVTVSAVQRGDRWLLAWLGRGGAPASRRLAFADFRGAGRAPVLGHIFTHQVAIDPVAIPGVARGARAVWPVLDLPGVFEGATDPSGTWRTAHVLPGGVSSYSPMAVATRPDGRRLVVNAVPQSGGLTAVTWSAAGASENLPPLRPLYTTPVLQSVAQMAAVFRARGGAAVVMVSRTAADPLQMQVEAVSIDGDVAAAPRLVAAGERLSAIDPPQVASLTDGRLVAVWRRISPPNIEVVLANERTVGGEWTPPIAQRLRGRAGIPSLVVTPSGQPAVTWSEGGRVRMRALRVGPQVTAGTSILISGSHTGCRQPAMSSSGRRTVTVAFACESGRNLYVTSQGLPRTS